MKMRNKLLLLVATVAIVVVGAATFAAFESHIVNVKAHVEKATFVEPDELDLGTTLMQQSYFNNCVVAGPGVDGNPQTVDDDITTTGVGCLKIRLSASFLEQTDFTLALYNIYCEAKSQDEQDADLIAHGITHYMALSDSDPEATDSVAVINCVHEDAPGSLGPPGAPGTAAAPIFWAQGQLATGNDEYDLWDFDFHAPVCSDNWNEATDTSTPPPTPIDRTIAQGYCHTLNDGHNHDGLNDGDHPELGGNSDAFVNLGSNVKFQITGFNPCEEAGDICVDADGIATQFSGVPAALETAIGDTLIQWSTTPTGGIEGIDTFDNDSSGGTWTAGDDIHLEGPTGSCGIQAVRDAYHDLGLDCKVLDINNDLVDRQPVSCDLEGFLWSCPPLLAFHDSNGNGVYDNGEDIFVDVNNNNTFD